MYSVRIGFNWEWINAVSLNLVVLLRRGYTPYQESTRRLPARVNNKQDV